MSYYTENVSGILQCNDRTVLLPNFKAIGQTQAELRSLKVEKSDVCIRPLFKPGAYLVS